MPPCCDTSSSPALHNARAIQFHPVHPSSFPTGRPATGLCTQTLADRKASLTPITLELASVCGGSLVTAALAVNQFLPGYRLSAPRSLSYYSAAVRSSAGPVWTGAARPHGSVVPTPPPPRPSPAPPGLTPFSPLTVCGGDLPPQVSQTFFSSVLLSIPLLVDESLNSLFSRCSTASHACLFLRRTQGGPDCSHLFWLVWEARYLSTEPQILHADPVSVKQCFIPLCYLLVLQI